MTSAAPRIVARTRPRVGAWFKALWRQQPVLTGYGVALLAFAALAAALTLVDPRTIDAVGGMNGMGGTSVWAKPAKFFLSVAVFALTMAWCFGFVRPERRGAATMRRLVVAVWVCGSFELVYISWQAARAMASHFNRTSFGYELMYGLMGVGAVLLVSTTLPLAWEIARRPAPGRRTDLVAAVVIGLLLCFVLGGASGGYMAQQAGHSVGAVGEHATLFGWNRRGGDLRVAHFLGMHAQQAIPALALLMHRAGPRWRWTVLVTGALLYALLTLGLFLQALAGRPFVVPLLVP